MAPLRSVHVFLKQTKGGFNSEDTGGFLLLKKKNPNHYPEQKILISHPKQQSSLFKFSAQDNDLEYFLEK